MKLFGLQARDPSAKTTSQVLTTISGTEITDELKEAIKSAKGGDVETTWKQPLKFFYNEDATDGKKGPTAILDHKTIVGGIHEHSKDELLARTIMTMIDNVICKSNELHISTPDPFVAEVARAYLAHLKTTTGLDISPDNIKCTNSITQKRQPDATKTFNIIASQEPYKAGSLRNHAAIIEAQNLRNSSARSPSPG
jgi:hypothetical protein